ncbi:MAG: DUF4229 domain-containing protein [Salinibacterium sp.]|nr:MAG: DUF4229 domain-containing protein [Salinibacterium sp.]
MKPWIAYSLVRLGLFAALFALFAYLGAQLILAAVLAAIISFCISYIFFSRLRDAVALDVAQRRSRGATVDADAEAEDRL